jgi:hypothetical protein
MLLILESTHLVNALKGIPAVRWMVELWSEKIRVTRVIVTEEGITFYRVPEDTVEDTTLQA